MPYSKDIRCGEGWFKTNVNCFYNYLDEIDEELIVREKFRLPWQEENKPDIEWREVEFHRTHLEEQIEMRVNEFISWRVFNETRKKLDEDDMLPEEFEDVGIWSYVYHHICVVLRKRLPTWYELRSTLPEEESDSE